MATTLCITQSSPFSHKLYSSKSLLYNSHRNVPFLKFQDSALSRRRFTTICFSSPRKGPDYKGSGPDWPILRRWDVPWNWQTVSLSSLACGLSFVLTGLIETASIPYAGLVVEELSLDEKAEILFADQAITTAVVLIVLFTLTKSSQPLPDDIYRYDLKEPFDLQRGWLLWAGIGLVGAIAAISLTGAAMSTFNGEPPQRETDALARLLPLIGSSSISTVSLLGITGVLAPILEETVFRGFFMVSLTKWLPTPLAALISGSVFALAHLTPGQFPQLFVLEGDAFLSFCHGNTSIGFPMQSEMSDSQFFYILEVSFRNSDSLLVRGTVLGFSYAQTRNLLTPITIHAFWNSGVILLLTFLQLQGYDIKEIIQAT